MKARKRLAEEISTERRNYIIEGPEYELLFTCKFEFSYSSHLVS